MHLIRQSIAAADAAVFPITALVIFIVALVWLFVWAARMPSQYSRRMSRLPLADDGDQCFKNNDID